MSRGSQICGLFYAEHFISSFRDNEKRGRKRIFMLRGMTLEIHIMNEVVSHKNGITKLDSFDLSVLVKKYLPITTSIYEVPSPPRWFHRPRLCNK